METIATGSVLFDEDGSPWVPERCCKSSLEAYWYEEELAWALALALALALAWVAAAPMPSGMALRRMKRRMMKNKGEKRRKGEGIRVRVRVRVEFGVFGSGWLLPAEPDGWMGWYGIGVWNLL